ncbi:hypothetical protein NDU88_002991 [Pleurodeles waltl]|uniref:Uncharacterized protein n=1 Tax=Pleurodeles waltl TaxID=8319 RepID=A0AAV7V027_PLEWA|nr:hypothetical protein NDU88_002991 [Pleurodeles waltl]
MPWSGLCVARWREEFGPGVGAGRGPTREAAWATGLALPRRPFGARRREIRGPEGSLWAPERLDCAVGLGPKTSGRPGGEGRSNMCLWIGGCRPVFFTWVNLSWA